MLSYVLLAIRNYGWVYWSTPLKLYIFKGVEKYCAYAQQNKQCAWSRQNLEMNAVWSGLTESKKCLQSFFLDPLTNCLTHVLLAACKHRWIHFSTQCLQINIFWTSENCICSRRSKNRVIMYNKVYKVHERDKILRWTQREVDAWNSISLYDHSIFAPSCTLLDIFFDSLETVHFFSVSKLY